MDDTEKEAAPEEGQEDATAASVVEDAETEAQQADEAADAGDEEKPKRKPRRSYQRRISQLTAEKRELERRLAEMQQTPAPQQASEKAPKRDDFDDYEDWIDAKAEWTAAQAVAKRLSEAEKQQAKAHEAMTAEQQARAFEDARDATVDRGAEQFDDFEEVAMRDDLMITDVMAQALLSTKKGHEVWYHLGKHPEVAEDIAQLAPTQQLIEIGKLEATLSTAKKPSKAPPPTQPVRGSGPANNSLRDNLSTAEWIKRRQSEVHKVT